MDTAGDDETVWRSPDGLTWRRSGSSFGPGHVDGLTTFGDMAVAAGTVREPNSVAAVWVSPDAGETWQRAGAGNPAFSIRSTTQMFGVTAAGPGVVAVGLSWDGRTMDAHAWVSADGRSWRRAADPPEWSGPGDQVLATACPLPGGGVVAFGGLTVQGDQDAWAWLSQDGITWERATGPGTAAFAGPGTQGVGTCASTPSRVIVTGLVPGPGGLDGVLWSSVDGRTWTAVGGPRTFGGPADDWLEAVAADGDRLVVTGVEDGDLTVQMSADDGATWHKRTAAAMAGFGLRLSQDVAIVGDTVVMTGFDGPSAAVWVGPGPSTGSVGGGTRPPAAAGNRGGRPLAG